ncbi:MAG: transglycosylase family protein [Acidimicrobiia bacterium]
MTKRQRRSTVLIGTTLAGGAIVLGLTGTAGAADPPAGPSIVAPPGAETPAIVPGPGDAGTGTDAAGGIDGLTATAPVTVIVPMAAPSLGQPSNVVLSPEALASGQDSAMQAVLIARPDGAAAIANSAPIYVDQPVTPAVPAGPSDAALAALRSCESHGNYAAVSAGGLYRGAYQFAQSTWNSVASRWAPHLVGVDPAAAAPADQDAMARALHAERGWAPWPTCGAGL